MIQRFFEHFNLISSPPAALSCSQKEVFELKRWAGGEKLTYTSPQQFLNFNLSLSLLPTCAPFSCSKRRVVGERGPTTPQQFLNEHFNRILSLLLPLSCSERSRVVGVHCKAGEEEEEVGARAAPPHLSSPPTWTQASPARTVTLFTCHPTSLPLGAVSV